MTHPSNVLICEVLARAIAAQPDYASCAWDEIHSLLHGRAKRPTRPRKRGYTNISIKQLKEGLVLQAPVQIARRLRFVQGNLIIQGQVLPKLLLTGMKGKPIQQIADHPFLAGYAVRFGNANGHMSWFNIERVFLPLLSTPFAASTMPGNLEPYAMEAST